MEHKMVLYTGGGYRIKKGLCPPCFSAHGMTFKTGIVYKVTDSVFEYLKGIRGFHEVLGMGNGIIDFPKIEKKVEKNDKNTMGIRPSDITHGLRTSDKKPAQPL